MATYQKYVFIILKGVEQLYNEGTLHMGQGISLCHHWIYSQNKNLFQYYKSYN